jgi:acid phosphatase
VVARALPLVLAAAVAASIAGAGGAVGDVRRAQAATAAAAANLWIDTTGGTCTRRPRPSTYADGRACESLQAAANAAAAGDLILVKVDTYRGQLLTGSKRLTIQGSRPGRPSFGQLIVSASNVTFRHLLIQNRDYPAQSVCSYFDYTLFTCGAKQIYDDVIVDALKKGSGDPNRRGGIQVESGSTDLVFKNGEIRSVSDQKAFQGGADRMLIDNNYWHDIRLTPAGEAAGVHNECAYVTGGNGQTWRRNRFIQCPVMAMFFANYLGGPPFTGVTVENNVFTHALNSEGSWHDGASFVIPNGAGGQNQVSNWVVRYNTFEVSPDFGSTPGRSDDNGSALFYGNLGADGACGAPEWTYRYNVGTTCGGQGEVSVPRATNSRSNPNQAPFYVDAPGGDFRLKPNAAALNRGQPEAHPPTDEAGTRRPIGSAADAGAYERVVNATTGILAIGGLDASRSSRSVGTAVRTFERTNPAKILVTLGNNDASSGHSFAAVWRTGFGWLRGAGVGVAGTLGAQDVRMSGGRYQLGLLRMPARYYVRRVGDAELIILDSTAVTTAQTRWLRGRLARKTQLFRIVILHHPPFACGGSSGDARVRALWVPLFQRYGVRLVLSGHERNYQRFLAGGVTYVVQGAGAAARPSTPRACPSSSPARQAAKAARGYLYVTVDAGGVVVRVVDLSGVLLDRFRVA